LANGTFYQGEWQNKKKNGYGILRAGETMVFEGIWKDNKANGWGKLI
jgi:hypothetical protein